jgi:dihydrofolate reductase
MVFLDMAMSLDGFVTGPDGGDARLHDWYFSPTEADRELIEGLVARTGAMLLGRRSFGDHEKALQGGYDTPYKVPHFVLSHEARAPFEQGGATYTFVDGFERALEQAQEAAGDKDVCLAGGANVARQALEAGLLDEVYLHLVPRLLGSGVSLFEGVAADLERTQVTLGEGVTHLRFRVLQEG